MEATYGGPLSMEGDWSVVMAHICNLSTWMQRQEHQEPRPAWDEKVKTCIETGIRDCLNRRASSRRQLLCWTWYWQILPVCVYVYNMHSWCWPRSEERVGSHGTGVMDGCELLFWCWERNPAMSAPNFWAFSTAPRDTLLLKKLKF